MPNLELNDEIARIVLDPVSKQVLNITVYEENLRFECKRCATFCCKLGGPKLTKRDIKRVEKAGYGTKGFFDSFKGGSSCSSKFLGCLKSEEDGSCVFLRRNPRRENYSCVIYGSRPGLCRLYPFDFQRINPQALMVRLIPFCRGLGTENGALVNERFFFDLLNVAHEIL